MTFKGPFQPKAFYDSTSELRCHSCQRDTYIYMLSFKYLGLELHFIHVVLIGTSSDCCHIILFPKDFLLVGDNFDVKAT